MVWLLLAGLYTLVLIIPWEMDHGRLLNKRPPWPPFTHTHNERHARYSVALLLVLDARARTERGRLERERRVAQPSGLVLWCNP